MLSALALVMLVPGAFGVIGGFFPRLPVVGPFGLVLNTGYPWILFDLVVSSCAAGIAVALGGRKTRLLLFVDVGVLAAAGFIGFRYVTFAMENGASYDFLRAANGFPSIPYADQKVVFANVDGKVLGAELWFPADAGTAPVDSMPAVVFVHGGAFQAGFPGTRPLLMDALDRAGVVAVDIDYRLSPPPTWDKAPADVLCALAWVGGARELAMVDPARVVLVGESAGGNLALVAGYAAGMDAIASSCPERGEPVVPAGVFAIAPTADLVGIWEDETIHDYDGSIFPEVYIGGPPSQYPERYDAAEPFRLLRPNLPPTLILAADIDRLVHVERLRAFAERATAAGAEVRLMVAPFAGHGFDGEPNSFGQQLTEKLIPAFATNPRP